MTAHEIETVLARYQVRIAEILTPEELVRYNAYQRRVQGRLNTKDSSPVLMTPEEQMIADKIAADMQAAGLNRQFLALTGLEKLPQ